MRNRYAELRMLAASAFVAISVCTAAPSAVAASHAETAPNPDTRPVTIPAVQTWTGGQGELALKNRTKIVVGRSDADELLPIARQLESALESGTRRADVVVSSGHGGKGDIVLALAEDIADIGEEGYELHIGRTVTIEANTNDGVFYGTQTILQLLGDGTTLPIGTATDWPRYEERGLMVDIARMHFSPDWLKARIRDMAYLKMNYLHLHLTDDEGWRIESDLGLQSAQHLTKDDIADLVAYAARHHITVVPEIDMPAHLGQLLAKYPQYRLVDADGTVSPTKIDFTIPAARELLKRIIAEYLPLFPGEFWHLGTDEYLANSQYANYPQLRRWAKENVGPDATAKDAVIQFANEMNAFVRSHGKTSRVWNDNLGPGTTIEVDTDVVVQFWTDSDSEDFFGPNGPFTPQTLLDKGYEVVNDSFLPTYTAPPGGQSVPPRADYLYEQWSLERFYGYLFKDETGTGGPFFKPFPDKVVAVGAPGLRGSNLNMWNSGGTWTTDEATADIYPRMRSMAQQAWDSEFLVPTYDEFLTAVERVGSPN